MNLGHHEISRQCSYIYGKNRSFCLCRFQRLYYRWWPFLIDRDNFTVNITHTRELLSFIYLHKIERMKEKFIWALIDLPRYRSSSFDLPWIKIEVKMYVSM